MIFFIGIFNGLINSLQQKEGVGGGTYVDVPRMGHTDTTHGQVPLPLN